MNECDRNADCAAGLVCDAGVCIPADMGRCVNDVDCGAGSRCLNGECVRDEAECRQDDDCGLGQVCRNGACELAEGFGDPCVVDADCPANFQCTAEVCIPRVGEDECMLDGTAVPMSAAKWACVSWMPMAVLEIRARFRTRLC